MFFIFIIKIPFLVFFIIFFPQLFFLFYIFWVNFGSCFLENWKVLLFLGYFFFINLIYLFLVYILFSSNLFESSILVDSNGIRVILRDGQLCGSFCSCFFCQS